MFKYLVFVLLLGYSTEISARGEGIKKMSQVVHDACVAKTGVDEKAIEDCNKGIFKDDPKLKCYMKCLLTRVLPLMNADGDMDIEALIMMLPSDDLEGGIAVVRNCGTQKGADDCETAFLTNKCWYKENPALYFIV